jgi:hypothetical protein
MQGSNTTTSRLAKKAKLTDDDTLPVNGSLRSTPQTARFTPRIIYAVEIRLARWVGGVERESMPSKKIAETALEYAPNADVERFLLLIDKLYISNIVSKGAIKRYV